VWKNIFSLSQGGLAEMCEFVIGSRQADAKTNRAMRYASYYTSIRHGDRVFIILDKQTDLRPLLKTLAKKSIKVAFFIMVEPVIPAQILELIMPFAIRIFVQNNVIDHPIIHNLPIGIRDSEYYTGMHLGFSQYDLRHEGRLSRTKHHTCLLCYSDWTHYERKTCSTALADKAFVFDLSKKYADQGAQVGPFGMVPPPLHDRYAVQKNSFVKPVGCLAYEHSFRPRI
jgi:hypothetical protein